MSKFLLHLRQSKSKRKAFYIPIETQKKLKDAHSYVHEFEVTSEWKTVKLNLSNFYPRYRGRTLNLPNFEADVIEEIAFLIGNKKEENFQLEIDNIYLSK